MYSLLIPPLCSPIPIHQCNNKNIARAIVASSLFTTNSRLHLPRPHSTTHPLSSTVVPCSVPVRVAHELLQAGHHYLDVRTPEEFSAGHAVDAVNIPYMFKLGSGMTKNPNFVDQVLSHFRRHDEIIVGCQSGKRSISAATELLSAGFTGITDIAGGFAAWSYNKLPNES